MRPSLEKRIETQKIMDTLDIIKIEDLTDNLDTITFTHVKTCFHCGTTQKQDVEIWRPHYDDYEGTRKLWTVLFSGAIDYEGNKRDMLKRYPEFKGITTDLKG